MDEKTWNQVNVLTDRLYECRRLILRLKLIRHDLEGPARENWVLALAQIDDWLKRTTRAAEDGLFHGIEPEGTVQT